VTVICTTPNTVKEIRTLHMRGHASLKILQNVVHATGFYSLLLSTQVTLIVKFQATYIRSISSQ